MKRILIVLLCLVCLCKANAQPNYDVEIDGLCYTLNLNESTAGLVHVQPSVSEVDVPSSIMIGDRNFIVDNIMLDCWNYTLNYDFSYINTIHIPNTVVELRLRFGSENCAVLPTISSLTIPSSIEVVTLWGIKGLTSIVIPASVKEVEYIAYLPDLLDLIIEDDPSTLRWSTEASNFKGININLNYIYLGRQLTRHGSSYPYHFFGGNCPNNVEIGSNVHDLSGYNLFPQTVVIPNTVRVGVLGNNALDEPKIPNKVVFEDGIDEWKCSSFHSNLHTAYGKGWSEINEWYIGRPGVTILGLNAEFLTMGPLLKSHQVADVLSPEFMYYNLPCSVKGDSAYIKLYQFVPPVLYEEDAFFDNETYMYTPLYVPIGSKRLYEQAYHWRNFFNIVEFDYESPYISVFAMSNDNTLGRVSGYGEFDTGEMVTLTATGINHNYFLNWTENGEIVSTDRIYTFVAERNRELVANFKYGTGVDENGENLSFSVFANNRTIVVEGAEEASEINVYNVQGQCIYMGKEKKIVVSDSGLYVVAIENKKIKVVVD